MPRHDLDKLGKRRVPCETSAEQAEVEARTRMVRAEKEAGEEEWHYHGITRKGKGWCAQLSMPGKKTLCSRTFLTRLEAAIEWDRLCLQHRGKTHKDRLNFPDGPPKMNLNGDTERAQPSGGKIDWTVPKPIPLSDIKAYREQIRGEMVSINQAAVRYDAQHGVDAQVEQELAAIRAINSLLRPLRPESARRVLKYLLER